MIRGARQGMGKHEIDGPSLVASCRGRQAPDDILELVADPVHLIDGVVVSRIFACLLNFHRVHRDRLVADRVRGGAAPGVDASNPQKRHKNQGDALPGRI